MHTPVPESNLAFQIETTAKLIMNTLHCYERQGYKMCANNEACTIFV